MYFHVDIFPFHVFHAFRFLSSIMECEVVDHVMGMVENDMARGLHSGHYMLTSPQVILAFVLKFDLAR